MRDFADGRRRRRRGIEAGRLENHPDRDAVLGRGQAPGHENGEADREQQAVCGTHGRGSGSYVCEIMRPKIASPLTNSSSMQNPLPASGKGVCLKPTAKRGLVRVGAAGRAAAPLGHEALELLAVLGAPDRLDIFGELALRLVELAALLIEPDQLGLPPLVEGDVAGRGGVEATGPSHSAAAPRRTPG